MSAFYSDENKHIGEKYHSLLVRIFQNFTILILDCPRYARFAFCKTEEVLEAARLKLEGVKKLIQPELKQ